MKPIRGIPQSDSLPFGWASATLGGLSLLNPRGFDTQPEDGDLLTFVPMAAVEAGTGRLDPGRTRPWKEIKKGYTPFQNGDVLFAKITPCMENGKAAIAVALTGGRGAGSTEFHVLRPASSVPSKFLLLFLSQESFRRAARASMKGTAGQLRVPESFLESATIPVPPLSEQERIIEEVEKQFTRLDAAVEALKRVRAKLKRYRASLLKAACEGRLVPTEADLACTEARGYEPADVLLQRVLKQRRAKWEADELAKIRVDRKTQKDDKRIATYKEPARPDKEALPGTPKGWEWATFEQVSLRVTVGFVGPMKHEYVPAGIPFLRSQNVRENRFDPTGLLYISERFHSKIRKSAILPGDIAIVRSGSVGVTCVIPATLPEANCADLVLVQRPLAIVPEYGSYYMNSAAKQGVARGKVGIALTHFNTKSVASLPIAVPPLAEQHRIVAEVERRLSVIDELEALVSANLKRAERLRQSILKRAFEGKLVPQDPKDEPASVLLERILAERAATGKLTAACKGGKRRRP